MKPEEEQVLVGCIVGIPLSANGEDVVQRRDRLLRIWQAVQKARGLTCCAYHASDAIRVALLEKLNAGQRSLGATPSSNDGYSDIRTALTWFGTGQCKTVIEREIQANWTSQSLRTGNDVFTVGKMSVVYSKDGVMSERAGGIPCTTDYVTNYFTNVNTKDKNSQMQEVCTALMETVGIHILMDASCPFARAFWKPRRKICRRLRDIVLTNLEFVTQRMRPEVDPHEYLLHVPMRVATSGLYSTVEERQQELEVCLVQIGSLRTELDSVHQRLEESYTEKITNHRNGISVFNLTAGDYIEHLAMTDSSIGADGAHAIALWNCFLELVDIFHTRWRPIALYGDQQDMACKPASKARRGGSPGLGHIPPYLDRVSEMIREEMRECARGEWTTWLGGNGVQWASVDLGTRAAGALGRQMKGLDLECYMAGCFFPVARTEGGVVDTTVGLPFDFQKRCVPGSSLLKTSRRMDGVYFHNKFIARGQVTVDDPQGYKLVRNTAAPVCSESVFIPHPNDRLNGLRVVSRYIRVNNGVDDLDQRLIKWTQQRPASQGESLANLHSLFKDCVFEADGMSYVKLPPDPERYARWVLKRDTSPVTPVASTYGVRPNNFADLGELVNFDPLGLYRSNFFGNERGTSELCYLEQSYNMKQDMWVQWALLTLGLALVPLRRSEFAAVAIGGTIDPDTHLSRDRPVVWIRQGNEMYMPEIKELGVQSAYTVVQSTEMLQSVACLPHTGSDGTGGRTGAVKRGAKRVRLGRLVSQYICPPSRWITYTFFPGWTGDLARLHRALRVACESNLPGPSYCVNVAFAEADGGRRPGVSVSLELLSLCKPMLGSGAGGLLLAQHQLVTAHHSNGIFGVRCDTDTVANDALQQFEECATGPLAALSVALGDVRQLMDPAGGPVTGTGRLTDVRLLDLRQFGRLARAIALQTMVAFTHAQHMWPGAPVNGLVPSIADEGLLPVRKGGDFIDVTDPAWRVIVGLACIETKLVLSASKFNQGDMRKITSGTNVIRNELRKELLSFEVPRALSLAGTKCDRVEFPAGVYFSMAELTGGSNRANNSFSLLPASGISHIKDLVQFRLWGHYNVKSFESTTMIMSGMSMRQSTFLAADGGNVNNLDIVRFDLREPSGSGARSGDGVRSGIRQSPLHLMTSARLFRADVPLISGSGLMSLHWLNTESDDTPPADRANPFGFYVHDGSTHIRPSTPVVKKRLRWLMSSYRTDQKLKCQNFTTRMSTGTPQMEVSSQAQLVSSEARQDFNACPAIVGDRERGYPWPLPTNELYYMTHNSQGAEEGALPSARPAIQFHQACAPEMRTGAIGLRITQSRVPSHDNLYIPGTDDDLELVPRLRAVVLPQPQLDVLRPGHVAHLLYKRVVFASGAFQDAVARLSPTDPLLSWLQTPVITSVGEFVRVSELEADGVGRCTIVEMGHPGVFPLTPPADETAPDVFGRQRYSFACVLSDCLRQEGGEAPMVAQWRVASAFVMHVENAEAVSQEVFGLTAGRPVASFYHAYLEGMQSGCLRKISDELWRLEGHLMGLRSHVETDGNWDFIMSTFVVPVMQFRQRLDDHVGKRAQFPLLEQGIDDAVIKNDPIGLRALAGAVLLAAAIHRMRDVQDFVDYIVFILSGRFLRPSGHDYALPLDPGLFWQRSFFLINDLLCTMQTADSTVGHTGASPHTVSPQNVFRKNSKDRDSPRQDATDEFIRRCCQDVASVHMYGEARIVVSDDQSDMFSFQSEPQRLVVLEDLLNRGMDARAGRDGVGATPPAKSQRRTMRADPSVVQHPSTLRKKSFLSFAEYMRLRSRSNTPELSVVRIPPPPSLLLPTQLSCVSKRRIKITTPVRTSLCQGAEVNFTVDISLDTGVVSRHIGMCALTGVCDDSDTIGWTCGVIRIRNPFSLEEFAGVKVELSGNGHLLWHGTFQFADLGAAWETAKLRRLVAADPVPRVVMHELAARDPTAATIPSKHMRLALFTDEMGRLEQMQLYIHARGVAA